MSIKNNKTKNDLQKDMISPRDKGKQYGKWFVFGILLILYTLVYFFIMSLDTFPELKSIQFWIKFLIYIFIMVIFFGPFIPFKRKEGKRISIIGSLARLFEGPKRYRYKPKPQSKLNVVYKPPLISKCKCGVLLTRQMEKCPNCQRSNRYYVSKK